MTIKKPSRLLQTSHLRRDAKSSLAMLHKLVDMGGKATRQRLINEFGYDAVRNALVALLQRNFVREADAVIILTPIGKDEAAYHAQLDSADKHNQQPAPIALPVPVLLPRVRIDKPLRINSKITWPIRAGKDDHLQIPSLMGGVRKLPGSEVVG